MHVCARAGGLASWNVSLRDSVDVNVEMKTGGR